MKASGALILILIVLSCLWSCVSKTNQKKVSDSVKTTTTSIVVNDPILKKLVDENRRLFAIYHSLSPMSNYSQSELHIPQNELKEIIKDAIKKDTIDGGSLIEYYQIKIYDNLTKILTYKTIYRYDLKKLLENEELYVTVSPDGKFYNLDYDEKTGGTYRSRISIIHYRSSNNLIYNSFESSSAEDKADSSGFDTDGYGTIDTIHTKEGVKYLLQGSVSGCSTCEGQYIELVRFSKGKFEWDFSYRLDTRWNGDTDDASLYYDKKTRTILVDYTTDDIRPYCDCDEGDADTTANISTVGTDTVKQPDDTPPLVRKKCSCIFVFDGKTFVESTSKAIEKRK